MAITYDEKNLNGWAHVFQSVDEMSKYYYGGGTYGGKYKAPCVAMVKENSETISYNKADNVPLNYIPLTFKIKTDGTICWRTNDSHFSKTIMYTKDNGLTWVSIESTVDDDDSVIEVSVGDTIRFKASNSSYANNNGIYYCSFSGSTAKFDIEGNIMSLIGNDSFANLKSLSYARTFYYLFSYTKVISAKNLVLPATSLNNGCYGSMFYNCESLTIAPSIIPAKTMAASACTSMFSGCKSLTTAPELPATTLASYCYQYMFSGCKSLKKAPELPALSLANYCYDAMFYGCTSLNYIKCLATNTGATNCTRNWVGSVAPTGTFVKHFRMTNWRRGVAGIPTGWILEDYNPYLYEPLTFRVTTSGVIRWTCKSEYPESSSLMIQYKKNNDDWVTIKSGAYSDAPEILVSNGDVIQFRGDNGRYGFGEWPYSSDYNTFSGTTAKFTLEGNIASLIDSEKYMGSTEYEASGDYVFGGLFVACTGLTSATNLMIPLPKNTSTDACCYSMFSGCTSLTAAPELISTNLGIGCYYDMFASCTSLTTAPKLPATTLANNCYASMFYNCTSLTTAPALPATTLATHCYQSMFYGCTSLRTAPALPTTTLTNSCYRDMFWGCISLRTAPALPATTLEQSCYYSMFYGCTSLTTAPSLSATKLEESCYYQMFRGCTGLTTAPSVLPATELKKDCYASMFYGCTSLTAAPELPAIELTTSCYANMFDGCTNLSQIKCLATTNITSYASTGSVYEWVKGVQTNSGTFIKNPSYSGWSRGVSGVPNNWTIQNAA